MASPVKSDERPNFIVFVADDMELVELMALMKKERRQIVVVLDRYGATAGIVSMDDLLQELVGPLPSEEEAAGSNGKGTP